MQKVYRLLRNNQESGPYSLEELLHTAVQPSDLIWVEGRSAAWAYPYEIEALKTYVPAPPKKAATTGSPASEAQRHTPDNSGRHIFVSLPDKPRKSSSRSAPASDPLEERAEAIRQRVQQLQPAAAQADASLHTHLARSLDSVEEEYTHWYYNKKVKPRKNYKGAILVVTLGAMIAGGLFAGQSLLKSSNTSTIIAPQKTLPTPSTQEQATTLSVAHADTFPDSTKASDTTRQSIPAATPVAHTRLTVRNKPAAQPITQPEPTPATVPETTNEATVVTEQPLPETTTQPTDPVAATEKKRKGLFGGLFRKKGDKDDPAPQGGTGDRKAKRREDKQPAAPITTNLADRLELRSDATRENWMLGVMGQKITLVNHNSQPIRSATVEVYYFGEDNSLLDRKKISFGNVGPKGQAIAALPDHRQAGRVTFQVLSATPVTEQ